VKFAYFSEITSQSLTLNGRSNANIKYLIDSASNITELTEANNNLFDVQDIFNKTKANIALDNINRPSKQKSLNGLKTIYAGGFRYEPILQNYSNESSNWSSLNFKFADDISILNPDPDSQITSSINNGMVLGIPTLSNPITYNPINTPSSNLKVTLNSGLNFNVTRNTPSDVELIQRVTGSITVNIKISPMSNQTALVWNEIANGGAGPFQINIPLPRTDLRILPLTNGSTRNMFDLLGSIALPSGFTAFGEETGTSGTTTTVVGNNIRTNFIITDQGLDYLTVIANSTNVIFEELLIGNSFSTNLVSFNINPGSYPIEGIDGLIVEAKIPFEGLLILPKGVQSTTLPLRNLNGNIGNILQIFDFFKTSTSPQIQFTSAPIASIQSSLILTSYFYTQSPSNIYLTGSIDNGYNSGSVAKGNWYFERGNSVTTGSVFTLLTASYDLSKLYYDHNTPGGEYYGNSLTQILPTSSIELGYQSITEYFNPKKGDLIRFYNHDNDNGIFPYSSIFEREIINIIPPGQVIGSGSNGTGSYENRLVFEVLEDKTNIESNIPNQACNTSGSNAHIMNFIMLSKIPDETNIIIIADKREGQTSSGILFTEDVSKTLKDEAGNIIKNLKSQNLI
jgi:hypothetical protein